ncbi:hypothetical protein [Halomonas heilongjiangensis]|uniref:hypothetical protein n=1 Tax=Halomonas heilongjiangensis TaxID=1387883 RepID=UPI0015E8C279|nr:hypothetical protein [Halomonas heilongjiangensis]
MVLSFGMPGDGQQQKKENTSSGSDEIDDMDDWTFIYSTSEAITVVNHCSWWHENHYLF